MNTMSRAKVAWRVAFDVFPTIVGLVLLLSGYFLEAPYRMAMGAFLLINGAFLSVRDAVRDAAKTDRDRHSTLLSVSPPPLTEAQYQEAKAKWISAHGTRR